MNEQNMKPGVYEIENGVVAAYGVLKELREFEDRGIKGVELKLIDYNGKSLGALRFCGEIDSTHQEDLNRGWSTEVLLKTAVGGQRDGSLRQTQRLKIWLTDFPDAEGNYTSYMVERKNGRRSLILRTEQNGRQI